MKTKRLLSWLLTLAMVAGMLPAPARAEGSTATISGDGAADKTGTMTITLAVPKKAPAATDLAFNAPTDLAYSGSDKAATVAAASGVTGLGTITVKYYSDASRTTEAAPKNVGTYYVGATVAEGDQYAASTAVLYGDGWTFEITKSTPAKPGVPEAEATTKDSVTLKGTDGYEYSRDGSSWQDSPVFGGLLPSTLYEFFQRVAATLNTNASDKSDAGKVTTEADTYAMTVTLVIKPEQTITAPDVAATYGDTGKSVSARTDGDGALGYAVKSGDAVTVNATTGALTIVKAGTATITVTAAETDTCKQATKDVTVTVAKAASSVTTAPEATNPTYNGKAQELVTAGTAEGGEMQYSLDGSNFSKEIPTGTDAKAYTVWYKVVGDANHNDTEPQSVTSTITKKGEPAAKCAVTFDANGGTGTMDKVSADKGATVTLPANAFAREGYTFSGWNTQADGKGTAYADKAELTLDADVTLYAQWTKGAEPTKPTYAVTSGSGSAWAEGSSGTLTFVFKRSEGDEETFRRFRSASVDGELLTKDRDYKASAGSLVIELQPAYLATLAAGEHTLTATFDDGTAEAKFTVTGASPEPTPEPGRDYPSPEMSNSHNGNITSKTDPVTYAVSQKVPEWATSVRTWVELESVLALTHGKEGVVVTVDKQPYEGAVVTIDGQKVIVEVADATALRGKTLGFSYTARLKDGADLSPYLNEAKNIASVPYKATTVFDGDESHVASSATEYVKFNVGAPKSGAAAQKTPAKTNALPKTGDPAPLAAVATLAATGAAFAAAGLRRRRKDQ